MFILGNCRIYFCASVRCFSSYEEVRQRSAPWKTMKIEFVGLKLFSPTAMSPTTSFIMGIPGFASQRQEMVAGRGRYQDHGGGHGFGRGRRQMRGCFEKISTEDLDADLDNYQREALQKKN